MDFFYGCWMMINLITDLYRKHCEEHSLWKGEGSCCCWSCSISFSDLDVLFYFHSRECARVEVRPPLQPWRQVSVPSEKGHANPLFPPRPQCYCREASNFGLGSVKEDAEKSYFLQVAVTFPAAWKCNIWTCQRQVHASQEFGRRRSALQQKMFTPKFVFSSRSWGKEEAPWMGQGASSRGRQSLEVRSVKISGFLCVAFAWHWWNGAALHHGRGHFSRQARGKFDRLIHLFGLDPMTTAV